MPGCRLDRDQADRDLERRGRGVHGPGPVGSRLRRPVGRRDPPGHPARRGQAVPAGDDRGRADGRKELVALADGYRESAESWADLLRDCARRGMRAPVLAIGDGALGFWTAVRRGVPAGQDPALLVPQDRDVLGALPSPRTPARRRPWPRSGTPRTRTTPARPSRPSPPPTGRSSPRPPPRSPRMRRSCWRSMTTRPSTGCTCARPTRSNLPSPRSAFARRLPRATGRRRPPWRWPSS